MLQITSKRHNYGMEKASDSLILYYTYQASHNF